MTQAICLKIEYSKPLELTDVSLALLAFGNEYHRFSEKSEYGIPTSKLYLQEIKNGSLIAVLQPIADQSSVFSDSVIAISGFLSELNTILSYFLGDEDKKPDFDKKRLENIDTLLNPISKDNKANLHISLNDNSSINNLQITINYQESNAIQNRIAKEKLIMSEPIAGDRYQVALTFQQTRNETDKGNRATIESIYNLPIRTVFENEDIHRKMILHEINPLTGIYIVDVKVETVNGKPVLYKISNFHDRIDNCS